MARSSNEMPFLVYTTTRLESPSAPFGRALGGSLNTELDMTAMLHGSATVHSVQIRSVFPLVLRALFLLVSVDINLFAHAAAAL